MSAIKDELKNLKWKDQGYVTTLRIDPTQGFDVIALEDGGAVVAYRYYNGSLEDKWQVGGIDNVVLAVEAASHGGVACEVTLV